MVCYSPKQAFVSGLTKEGKKKISFSVQMARNFERGLVTKPDLLIPCGQCAGCRLDYSMKWASRCLHERDSHIDNCFITLTYDPQFVPKDMSLCYKDFQDFMKRLRKACPDTVRFFMCGEYGDRFKRPHYHAILFGCDFDDKEFHKQLDGYVLYKSKTLQDLWGKGFCTLGEVNFNTIAYVARYIFKKVIGTKAGDYYYGRKPEFCSMSRKPGLASEYFMTYSDDLYSDDHDLYKGKDGYVKVNVSRYFDRQLEKLDDGSFDELKLRRFFKYGRRKHATFRQLKDALKVRKKSLSLLFRNLDLEE